VLVGYRTKSRLSQRLTKEKNKDPKDHPPRRQNRSSVAPAHRGKENSEKGQQKKAPKEKNGTSKTADAMRSLRSTKKRRGEEGTTDEK